MPTIRSEFNIEQFEEVLQKLAHELALDALTNMNYGTVRIVIHGTRMNTVETDKATVRFYANHIGYHEESTRNYEDWWGFDVEDKVYTTSAHSTKISYYAPDGKEKEVAEKITRFIDKLMAEAVIKPVPRFSLAKHGMASRK